MNIHIMLDDDSWSAWETKNAGYDRISDETEEPLTDIVSWINQHTIDPIPVSEHYDVARQYKHKEYLLSERESVMFLLRFG